MPPQKYAFSESQDVKLADKKKDSCCSTKTKIGILCLIIAALSCAVIALAILFYNKGQDLNVMEKKYNDQSMENQQMSDDNPKSNLCLTPTCVQTANKINLNMDPSADPCDSFYQYACGGWEERHHLKYFSLQSWSVVDDIASADMDFFRRKLEMPVHTNSIEGDVKARTLYHTCMKAEEVEDLGLSEARELIDRMGGLSFNTSEPYEDFDLTERLIQLSEYKVSPLFAIGLDIHRHIPRTFILSLSPPEEPLLWSKNDSQKLWTKLAEEMAVVWNDLYEGETPPPTGEFLQAFYVMSDIKDILDLVATYTASWNDTILTVDELQALCPKIDWHRVVKAIANGGNIPEKISVTNKAYFIALDSLIGKWNNRTLDNFAKLSLATQNLVYFPSKYKEWVNNLINRLVLGRTTWQPEPRWWFCTVQIKSQVPYVLSRWFIEDHVKNEDMIVEDVTDMIEHIRTTYIEVLRETELMDKKTSDYAIKKIRAMVEQVVYPDEVKNVTFIKGECKDVVANESSSFFMNIMNTRKAAPYKAFTIGTIDKETWDSYWLDYPYVVNGFYMAAMNRFTILGGILQDDFYRLNNPKFINYGSMGFTIGHEFTHGFDDSGRHYDINGLLNSWWTNKSEENYSKAKICYQNQYSSIELSPFDSNDTFFSNGNLTLDENIADNGAENVVFRAYQEWIKENGEEKILPSPYLDTWQKQYYMSQAQAWCGKYTKSALSISLNSLVHSQKEVRVNGMFQNSIHFSDVFQCPVGSNMNPKDKCKLW